MTPGLAMCLSGIEAAELHWVPLSWLTDPLRRQTLTWKVAGLRVPAPCIELGGARLWGLSLMMTRELLKVAGLVGPRA